MITDKLSNINKYSEIPDYVVDFIIKLSEEIKLGRYELENNSYVNVETYLTKKHSEACFEAHKKYADIQILISGKEKIFIKPVESLVSPLEYSDQKDIIFYEDNTNKSDYVTLDGSNFVLIYPHEAHAPQIAIDDNPESVKKAVVKLFL